MRGARYNGPLEVRPSAKIEVCPCPICGAEFSGAAKIDHQSGPAVRLVDGAITVCIECGAWSLFEAGKVRVPTADEVLELDDRTRAVLARVGDAIKAAHANKR